MGRCTPIKATKEAVVVVGEESRRTAKFDIHTKQYYYLRLTLPCVPCRCTISSSHHQANICVGWGSKGLIDDGGGLRCKHW